MADINGIKDASGYTIDDYKRMYNEAKAANNAEGMAAANKAANAIRESQNVTAEWATEDVANVAAGSQKTPSSSSGSYGENSYTPLNQTSHAGANWNNFVNELNNSRDYAKENSDVTNAFTQDEFDALYGSLAGISKADRVYQEGASHADEDLLDDKQYAALQYEKQQWNTYDELYRQAVAAGDTALAQKYLALRDQAHTNAERIRAGAWLGSYSGGADGSMHLTYGALADNSEKMTGVPGGTGDAYNAYAEAIAQQHPNLYGNASDVQAAINNLNNNSFLNILNGLLSGSGSSGGTTVQTPTVQMPTTQTPTTQYPTVQFPTVTLPESGSVVGSGSGSYQDKITDYSEYIKEMQAAQLEANIAALDAAYQKNVAAIDRAGEGIGSTYQDARNQTVGASELAGRNFAEIAAASGLNSGTGGQAELARNVTLQNNLNLLNAQEAQSIADLDLQRANAETDYNTAIAQANAEGKYQEAYLLYQEKIRVESAIIDAMQREWNQAVTEYQLKYQAIRDQVSDQQWQKSFDLAYQQWQQDVQIQMAQLEIQKQSLSMQQQQLNAELAQMSASASGAAGTSGTGSVLSGLLSGYGTGSYTPTTTTTPTSDKISYNNGGLPSGVVKQLQNYFGLAEDGYWGPNSQSTTGYANAMDALKAYNAANPLPTSNNGGSNSVQLKNHLYGSGYDSAYSTIQSMVAKRASADEIVAQLNALYNAGELTSMGVENLLTSFNIGGYRSGQ